MLFNNNAFSKVSHDQAMAYANSIGIPYIECSARLGNNVVEAFHELVRIVRKFQLTERTNMVAEMRPKRSICSIL